MPLLQIHYEYSDKRNDNRIPIGNTLPSLKDISAIHQYLFLIPSFGIRTIQIPRPILIVLLKTKLMNNYVPIAIEQHTIVSRLQQANYRSIWYYSRYAIYCVSPTIVMSSVLLFCLSSMILFCLFYVES